MAAALSGDVTGRVPLNVKLGAQMINKVRKRLVIGKRKIRKFIMIIIMGQGGELGQALFISLSLHPLYSLSITKASPHEKESDRQYWNLNSTPWISDTLSVERGYRILTVCQIPDSLSCILDSNAQNLDCTRKTDFQHSGIQITLHGAKSKSNLRRICRLPFPYVNPPHLTLENEHSNF